MSRTEPERGREQLANGLSARFVELRRKAGLTRQGVADVMGKSRARKMPAGRLERGGVQSAGLLTVAEYLRAVRAGFGDLKDVLDRYTSLPIPEPVRKRAEAAPLPRVSSGGPNLECVQRRAAAFPEKRELCSRTPNEDMELQILRVRRRAGYWVLRRLFEFYLHTGLNSASIPPYIRFRRIMATYARRVFNALYRTHRAKAAKRAERLARLRASAEKRALDTALAEYAEAIAELAYDEMREHDELDWMPPPDEAYAIMAVKPKHRVVTDSEMCLAEWADVSSRYNVAVMAVYERAHKAALDVAESARCDARTLVRYKQAAMRSANIARSTAPDTPRRKQSVTSFHATEWPEAMDRKLLDRILTVALATWDAGIPTLPPAPGPKPV
jgi:hypothetical protein